MVRKPASGRRRRPWSGRSTRWIAGTVSLALTVTLLDGVYAAAASAPHNSKAPKKAAATQAADIPSARVAARLSGRRVEALSERTETSTTWVNKDGSLTTELTAGPVRFRDKATGQWRNVDVNLVQNADGSVESKAHPRGLRLAGRSGTPTKSMKAARTAKATDLVTLGAGDQQITLQWKGDLPKPTLDGTRADYVNAVPGADVVVEATRTGFEQYVQIKQRPDAGGYSYTLPLKAKGLKAKQLSDGSVLFTDRKNKKRAMMPAPVMWDATVDKRSGEHTHKARVGLKVEQKGSSIDLVVTPDAKFLADPETTYPVTVDPSTSSLSNVFDTYVQQGETVDWSADTELDLGNPGTKNADGTPRTARSFITWNTAPFSDALVSKATLNLWNFHSANTDCKAYPWEVWDTGKPTTSSRWTSQPAWNQKFATSAQTTGNPGCSTQPDGWITADVTNLAQTWSSAKNSTSNMGLRASDESVVAQWKRVNSANAASNPPKLVVTYNYRPRTGTDQQAGPPFFKASSGTWYVNTLTPTLRDTFADPNNDKVQGFFQIADNATGTQVGEVPPRPTALPRGTSSTASRSPAAPPPRSLGRRPSPPGGRATRPPTAPPSSRPTR
ncbi:DNRLRE domain-containing protein [Streptomyces sp. MUM 2J]|nr:DNRLRE domain-containing protein [Streptomyces sp. MUM 2J]